MDIIIKEEDYLYDNLIICYESVSSQLGAKDLFLLGFYICLNYFNNKDSIHLNEFSNLLNNYKSRYLKNKDKTLFLNINNNTNRFQNKDIDDNLIKYTQVNSNSYVGNNYFFYEKNIVKNTNSQNFCNLDLKSIENNLEDEININYIPVNKDLKKSKIINKLHQENVELNENIDKDIYEEFQDLKKNKTDLDKEVFNLLTINNNENSEIFYQIEEEDKFDDYSDEFILLKDKNNDDKRELQISINNNNYSDYSEDIIYRQEHEKINKEFDPNDYLIKNENENEKNLYDFNSIGEFNNYKYCYEEQKTIVCNICQSEFNTNDLENLRLDCGHYMHFECFKAYIVNQV